MGAPWPEWFNKSIISRSLNEPETILNISANPAVSIGEHFLSTILRVEVDYKSDYKDSTIEKTSFIVKSFPPGHLQKFIQENDILMKELKMYTTILPIMSNILGKHITPKYFESGRDDVLVLEDLAVNNFKTGSRIKGLDFNHCTSAMKTLAEFHGASYIMNKNHPHTMEFVKKEVHYTDENVFQKVYVSNCFKIVSDELKNWPGFEKYSTKLFSVRERMWQETIKEILPKDNEISVLNHGDFWTNNILFRHEVNDQNKITEVRLIDFQFCRWSTPAVDLHIFSIISLRDKEYMATLIDIYLKRLNELIHPQVLTRTQLLDMIHRTECIGLVISVCMLPMMLLDPSEIAHLKHIHPEGGIDGVNNNPLCRVGCKKDVYKIAFSKYLEYYESIRLL